MQQHHSFSGIDAADAAADPPFGAYDNAAAGDTALAAFGSRHRNDHDDDDDADVDNGGGARYDGGSSEISVGESGSGGGGGGGLLGWWRWLTGAKGNDSENTGMENGIWRGQSVGRNGRFGESSS